MAIGLQAGTEELLPAQAGIFLKSKPAAKAETQQSGSDLFNFSTEFYISNYGLINGTATVLLEAGVTKDNLLVDLSEQPTLNTLRLAIDCRQANREYGWSLTKASPNSYTLKKLDLSADKMIGHGYDLDNQGKVTQRQLEDSEAKLLAQELESLANHELVRARIKELKTRKQIAERVFRSIGIDEFRTLPDPDGYYEKQEHLIESIGFSQTKPFAGIEQAQPSVPEGSVHIDLGRGISYEQPLDEVINMIENCDNDGEADIMIIRASESLIKDLFGEAPEGLYMLGESQYWVTSSVTEHGPKRAFMRFDLDADEHKLIYFGYDGNAAAKFNGALRYHRLEDHIRFIQDALKDNLEA